MEHFTEINIKGMVCNRCIFTIKEALSKNGYPVDYVSLGKVIFLMPVPCAEKDAIRAILALMGFSLINDKNEELLSKIKTLIEDWVDQAATEARGVKLSVFLSEKLNRSYDTISEFFSTYEGKTIERFAISLRVDKVKELLVYTDKPLSEIAFITGFSSAHHLSFQFKKTTGLNTSAYRPLRVSNARSNSAEFDQRKHVNQTQNDVNVSQRVENTFV